MKSTCGIPLALLTIYSLLFPILALSASFFPIVSHAGNGDVLCAGDGRTPIKQNANTVFPIVIDKAGSYILHSNLTVTTPGATGIQIAADDVTLDLNGFSIVGDKGGGNDSRGIDARWRKNITIKNGTVRNFYSDGVAVTAPPAQNAIIEHIRASENGFAGIVAEYGVVKDCVASNNGTSGINTISSSIINCTVSNNGVTGTYYSGIQATNSTIVNCNASFNKNFGIYASDSTIIGCTANHNPNIGIFSYVHGGEHRAASSIVNCTANLNGIGIRMDGESRVEGCNVRDNTVTGIFVVGQHNYLIKNVISGTGANNLVVNEPALPNYIPNSGDNANVSW